MTAETLAETTLTEADAERFWSKVDKGAGGGCWLRRGGATFHWGGTVATIRRVSLMLAGTPPC